MFRSGMAKPPEGVVYLVRHGQTEWSRTGRHTGRSDVDLETEGRREAAGLEQLVAKLAVSLVLVSPLRRAQETCELAGLGHRAVLTDDLREWDYGDYEGRTTEEIRRERPGWNLWADGVPNGETATQVARRADRVIERILAESGDVACFAHGHLLRVLAARWVTLPPAAGAVLALAPGSLSVLGWEREQPVICRWNEVPAPPG
jgi:broad specificity phosphatase PhoE